MIRLTTRRKHKPLEYAFEMATSNVKFGRGATREVGKDFANLKCKKIMLVTDKYLANLPPVLTAVEALRKENLEFLVYDETRVEPTDKSWSHCINAAREYNPDAILAVGGGSAMDTAKAANLYYCHPEADLLDFVNAPIGKALPIEKPLLPLIAVTTTAGTGSEMTGMTIFDYEPLKAKTGIGSKHLRPTLGIIDPDHLQHAPQNVQAYTGFDVLCHALESYTAISWTSRLAPSDPKFRPSYQGRNPIADIWSLESLRMIQESFKKAVYDNDLKAQETMHMASSFAGIGFGNSGVHLCHGLSYPISGLIKEKNTFKPEGQVYGEHALVPHGLAVCITSPAIFNAVGDANDEIAKRCLRGAAVLSGNQDLLNKRKQDAGKVLADVVADYMQVMKLPNGISELGYEFGDIDNLIKGAMPQKRVLDLSPIDATEEVVGKLFEKSLVNY